MTALFARKAPKVMRDLMTDVPAFGIDDAAAVLGNIGGETGGFAHLQELKPVVKGSRGGYGWCQWTGPRRRAYEAWCTGAGLHPASDEANYGFLIHELRTTERRTVAAVTAAKGLEAKVIAFERSFERAGIPHHTSRIKWARLALQAYRREEAAAAPDPEPEPEPEPEPLPRAEPGLPHSGPSGAPDYDRAPPKPGPWQRLKGWLGWGTGTSGGLGLLGYLTDFKVVIVLVAGVIVVALTGFGVALWLFGKERVRDFIARQVRRCFP